MNKFHLLTAFVIGCFTLGLVAQQPNTQPEAKTATAHQAMMSGDMTKDMKMMNEMMVKMLGKNDAEYEKRFIDMMIPHHEGAILMAKDALKNASKPELKKMAEKMIEDQSKEIKMLKEYRDMWYGNK